jgi:hypothetical protein
VRSAGSLCGRRGARGVVRFQGQGRLALALENDFVVVTANTRDFMNLLDVELHPGVIMLREGSLSRDEQWNRLERALDHILKNADPAGFMINRVVEVMSAREIRVREIPPGEA